MFSSCPSVALAAGVKIGVGSLSPCRSPGGNRTPHTDCDRWYSTHPLPARYPRATHSTGITSALRTCIDLPASWSANGRITDGKSATSVESRWLANAPPNFSNQNRLRAVSTLPLSGMPSSRMTFVRADPVGGDDQQRAVADVVDVAHLAPAHGQRQIGAGDSGGQVGHAAERTATGGQREGVPVKPASEVRRRPGSDRQRSGSSAYLRRRLHRCSFKPFVADAFARRAVAVRSAVMSDRRRLSLLALLIVAASAVYLVGNGTTALWDRDEPRFAETSRQMLQSGDWVVPHFLDLPRTAKPAFIYWCQATAMAAFGDAGPAANFSARFPSALAIAVLLVVLSAVLWKRLGSQMTLWTVFIFATSGLTIAAAKMCITDAVLLLWVTIAQLCLYATWRGKATWPVALTWAVATGLAGLTKGPVILGVQAMTLGVLGGLQLVDRKWAPATVETPAEPGANGGMARPGRYVAKGVVAAAIVVAIVLPWVLMVNHRASAFIRTAVTHEVWDRMMTPLEQHAGPPGYYFASIWATFFPWSLLLPLAIGLGIHRRADPRSRFALAAVIGPWVMLECVRTKLPHYLLPAFPPLAYLTADALVRCLNGEIADLRGRPFKVAVTIWAVVIAAVASGPWLVVGKYPTLPIGAMAVMSVGGVAFAGAVATLIWRERLSAAAVLLGTGTLAIVLFVYGVYLPRADFPEAFAAARPGADRPRRHPAAPVPDARLHGAEPRLGPGRHDPRGRAGRLRAGLRGRVHAVDGDDPRGVGPRHRRPAG